MTQDQLARTVGISQPNVSAYERDRRIPTADTLNKLLVACGYQLAAADGTRVVYCPLPAAGWFPVEDLPPAEPNDPGDESSMITARTPMADRVRAIIDHVERQLLALRGPMMHPRLARLRALARS